MERRALVSVISCLLLQGLTAASVVEAAESDNRVESEDALYDVSFNPSIPDSDTLQDQFAHIDLQRVSIGPDSPINIPVAVQLRELPNQDSTNRESIFSGVTLQFNFGAANYQIVPNRFDCPAYVLHLELESNSGYRAVSCIESNLDVETNTIQWEIPKSALRDEVGRPLAPGSVLTSMQAISIDRTGAPGSIAELGLESDFRATDRVPDESGLDFVLGAGGQASEGVGFTVATAESLRETNGAKTTFRYPVIIQESTGMPRTLHVSVSGLWDGATAFSNQSIELAPQETKDESIYLELPFGHEHDLTRWFTVRYIDTGSGEWSEVDLGVHWLSIPQPSGHHSTLYFHSGKEPSEFAAEGSNEVDALGVFSSDQIWLNTAETDRSVYTTDHSVLPFPSYGGGPDDDSPSTAQHYWRPHLSPELSLGLNFSVEQLSELHLNFENLNSEGQFAITADLGICRKESSYQEFANGATHPSLCRGTWTVIGSSEELRTEADAQGNAELVMQIATLPEHVTVPYQPNNNFGLDILLREFTSESMGYTVGIDANTDPKLVVSTSRIDLALEEYEDQVDVDGLVALGAEVEQLSETLPGSEEVQTSFPANPVFMLGLLVGLWWLRRQ